MANFSVPDRAIENGTDDLESIENDIAALHGKFIYPIDQLRSIARPNLGSIKINKSDEKIKSHHLVGSFKDIQIDPRKVLESRTHAFYRMLGFPVAAPDGSYYNPGYNPTSGNKKEAKNQAVDSKIDNSLQTKLKNRETLPETLKKIFARQDIYSSIYSLVMRHVKTFNNLDISKGPFDDDPQTFTIDIRETEMQFFENLNPQLSSSISEAKTYFQGSAIGSSFSGGKHLLKPFIVDPRIDATVMPDMRKVCVPFLKDKNATRLNNSTYLSRPGIELIIRERLRTASEDKTLLKDIEKILSGETSPGVNESTLDRNTLLTTVFALSDENNIQDTNLLETFQGFTSIQTTMVGRLVKLIKSVIKKLIKAQNTIDEARISINWVPIPNVEGPEMGATGASLNRVGVNVSSDIDRKIAELKIKKLNAERRITEATELGDFASPFSINLVGDNTNFIEKELSELTQRRDRIAANAFNAMKEIEIITGEVSGLGLIDVLCIYTALWAIDMKTLLGFLDDDAFNRLVTYNPELITGDVLLRQEGLIQNMVQTLSEFESKLFNILSFADKLLTGQLASPLEDAGASL